MGSLVLPPFSAIRPGFATPGSPARGSGFATLAQSFAGVNEIWATTLENINYSGPAFQAKRADNNATFNIPFNGKHADPSYASNFSGTTAVVTTIYGQVSGLNATAMTGSTVPAFIDADGQWSFGYKSLETSVPSVPSASNKGLFVADNALLRPANPHLFVLANPGFYLPYAGPPYYGQGLFIEYGGTGLFYNVARYGFGWNIQGDFGVFGAQNGAGAPGTFQGIFQGTIGEAHMTGWHVWDYSCSTCECRFDAAYAEILNAQASANITYPANTQLNLMSDFDGNEPYYGSWRLIALYGSTQTSTNRNSISAFIMTDATAVTTLPTTYTDSGGFVYAPNYHPSGGTGGADLFGLQWSDEHGGYADHGVGPSFAKATNLSNPGVANLVRFGLAQYDSDVVITGAQRCERGAYGSTISKGGTCAIFAQIYLEPGTAIPTISGDEWAGIMQLHYGAGTANGGAVGVADIYWIFLGSEQFQVQTQKGVGGVAVTTNQGSAVPIVRGVWWNMLGRVTWSSGGTTDALQIYLWQNGNSATKIVDVTGALFDTGYTTAYPKQGAYTGLPGNIPALALRVANHQFSTTLTAFDSYITSPPALPAHS